MKQLDKSRQGTFREAGNRAYIVPAVDRAIRILSLLKTAAQGMTIADISDMTRWPKSSVHKLLVTLNFHGLLNRDETTKRYSLGVALSEYGRIALNGLDVRRAAKPLLKKLVEFSGETAALSMLHGSQMTIVDIEESPAQVRVILNVGMRSPATTTSNGKAVLAYLPENRSNEILRTEGLPAMTKKSITKIGAFKVELATTRKRGYATDFDEYQEGITATSAPVVDSGEQVIGTLSIAGPSFRMTKGKARVYGKKCAALAAELSAALR
jgi:IclR family transcriptional regulator, KDG regulon repressor